LQARVPHGESLHTELELLVEAGFSNLEALRAAALLPSEHFGLGDRGFIGVGKLADLVLVDGNPLDDITATRKIVGVWSKGVAVS